MDGEGLCFNLTINSTRQCRFNKENREARTDFKSLQIKT